MNNCRNMKENVIQSKSYQFSIRIVNVYKYLSSEKKDFVISKQILRSGTSIGANVEEAIGGQSRKDFLSKMSIAYKESRETSYWLRILKDTDYLKEKQFESLYFDLEEIQKLLTRIIKTTKNS